MKQAVFQAVPNIIVHYQMSIDGAGDFASFWRRPENRQNPAKPGK
jgi:hypothetical protein